mgnify:CR=1 FL=1
MAPSINEFEDLTQFADESFDTEDVDLFEYAEDDDSPLLRLKSIVLSLDWDITEDILNELSEELANLKALWKDDKVAQIYLQGMDNVGQYLRTEGAFLVSAKRSRGQTRWVVIKSLAGEPCRVRPGFHGGFRIKSDRLPEPGWPEETAC